MTASASLRALDRWPRIRLGVSPTPLVPADHLARALGSSRASVWLKHDDYTGFGLGGNKVRKLETELSPDRLEGVDTLITCGGTQSNHARVAAAAAARLGLRCVLVINGAEDALPTGNARLHRLLTPHVVYVATREERVPAMQEAKRDVEAQGRRALVVPLGASTGRGALGYALAIVELARQVRGDPGWTDRPVWIFVAASSGGTLAGMLLGRALLGWKALRIVAVSADDPADQIRSRVVAQAAEAAELIAFRRVIRTDCLTVTDEHTGQGYGIPTAASRDATLVWARSEGVLLDPTYTAKAAAGMTSWVGEGRVSAQDRVVFWHTGGQPALLA